MKNRHTVLDLFSGAGGLALGFAGAGFDLVCAIDNEYAAVETYRANIGAHVAAHDLSGDVTFSPVDVIIGGPPCQGFSSAGLRRAGDQRNTLVSRFAEIVATLRPVAFVFENVEGFLTSDQGAYVLDLLTPLVDAGYRIHLRKVNAANYGVPQHRKRVIVIGGLGWDPTFPAPTHAAFGAPGAGLVRGYLPTTPTLMDALRGLPAPLTKSWLPPTDHTARAFSAVDMERVKALRPGQAMRDLPIELWHESFHKRAFRRVMDGMPTERRGGAPHGIRRLLPDEPCKAVTGGARAEFVHPFEDRGLTLRELARIQTFPDDFSFQGTIAQREQLIGNAVPPLLALAIARNLTSDLQFAEPRAQPGALLSFIPTLSTGMSPILETVTRTVNTQFHLHLQRRDHDVPVLRLKSTRSAQQRMLWEETDAMDLTQAQRTIIARARAIGGGQQGIALDNATCSYLVAVIADDLGVLEQLPEISRVAGDLPDFFATRPLSNLRLPGLDFLDTHCARSAGVAKAGSPG